MTTFEIIDLSLLLKAKGYYGVSVVVARIYPGPFSQTALKAVY